MYATLKPRIEQAARDLGERPGTFDRTLERAIIVLLQTPAVDGPVRLVPAGLGYAFEDGRLEDLAPAQRQLLRVGPAHTRRIQSALRNIALALGTSPTALPAEPAR